jgi:hypothetical protein
VQLATAHCCSDQGCHTDDLDGQNTALTVGGIGRESGWWTRQIYELAALDQIQMCEANLAKMPKFHRTLEHPTMARSESSPETQIDLNRSMSTSCFSRQLRIELTDKAT